MRRSARVGEVIERLERVGLTRNQGNRTSRKTWVGRSGKNRRGRGCSVEAGIAVSSAVRASNDELLGIDLGRAGLPGGVIKPCLQLDNLLGDVVGVDHPSGDSNSSHM